MPKEKLPRRVVEKQEKVSYRLASEMENLSITVPDAFCEFVDNALDSAILGKTSILSIAIGSDEAQVTNLDTTGMAEPDLDLFLCWGESSKKDLTKIGRVGVGVKAGSRYLARSLKVECGKHGQNEYCVFEDPEWGTRREEKVHEVKVYDRLTEDGYVVSTLSGLKQRINPKELITHLASVYRFPIIDKSLKITVDGVEVKGENIPVEKNSKVYEIAAKLTNGAVVQGWAGQLSKDQQDLPEWINAGLRVSLYGRMIEDGILLKLGLSQWQLARLIGEINIDGPFKVSMDKKKLVRTSEEYDDLSRQLAIKLKPLIDELIKPEAQQIGEPKERRLMNELKAIINGGLLLAGKETAGIRKPAKRLRVTSREHPVSQKTHQPATPAPEKSIGTRRRTADYIIKDVILSTAGSSRITSGAEVVEGGIILTINNRYKAFNRIKRLGQLPDHILRCAAKEIAELSMKDEGLKIAENLEEYKSREGDFYAAFLEVAESRKKSTA